MYDATLKMSKEHREFLKKVKRKEIAVRITQVIILIAFFAVWEIAGRLKLIDPFLFSQPSRMLKTIINLSEDGSLFTHIWVTLSETLIGFALGTFIGIAIAIMLWWSSFASKVAEPYLIVLNSLPKIALGPIFIVWMGNGEAPIITMGLAISLIVTIISLETGFMQVDEDKIKLLKTFGATKYQILTKCILPASIPTIMSAIKINMGLSWVGVITGEFLVSKAGLGYLIVYGGQIFKLDIVMSSVLILSVLAALMYVLLVYIEKKIIKWQ
ncbi:ABC transporter permease [Thermoanaerobacterium sp. CMT5567-10]|uniref:ABC transporter permease n=1 Tax=Thermoanaerobacterium sp. CMT5567-10 TaxID=3061989 RepID=UPI0026E0F969|nr:ABC transporter permease [Thermoanaerobacterium sp. CMT5567-10]WKV10427.1 ABC transporter permease [Thermoanaerobacterium sp. CMT5567-10]